MGALGGWCGRPRGCETLAWARGAGKALNGARKGMGGPQTGHERPGRGYRGPFMISEGK